MKKENVYKKSFKNMYMKINPKYENKSSGRAYNKSERKENCRKRGVSVA